MLKELPKISLKQNTYKRLVRYCESLPIFHSKLAPVKLMGFFEQDKIDWDPWILKDGDIYRVFYLSGDRKVDPWWAQGKIASAISPDLKNWQELGTILEPVPENNWESGRILAGCTYKENGIYYLFYAAASKEVLGKEKIGLAISTDGTNWERYSNNPLIQIDDSNSYYASLCSWRKDAQQCRDPYLFKDNHTGYYYLFITTELKQKTSELGGSRSCIGLAFAEKITGPYHFLPPVAAPIIESLNEGIFKELERPQVIYKNNKYYLFFSCWPSGLNQNWADEIGSDWIKKGVNQLTASSLYCYVSDKITGPFKPIDKDIFVKGSSNTGLYGTNFIPTPTNPDQFLAYGWYHRIGALGITPFLQGRWSSGSMEIYRTR